jgi:hypothetical protein
MQLPTYITAELARQEADRRHREAAREGQATQPATWQKVDGWAPRERLVRTTRASVRYAARRT